jgi:inner membrane transporter RhtA
MRLAAVPPQALLLASIASVQFGAAFATQLFGRVGPGGMVLFRLGLSAVLLLAFTRPSVRGRSARELATVAVFGLVLGAMNWSFYECLARMPLGPAVTIELMGPLVLAVVGSRRRSALLWIVRAGGGVALLATRGGEGRISALGVALASTAGVLWVAYILLSQRVGRSFASVDGLALALVIGTLVVLPVGLAQGGTHLLAPVVLGGGFAVAVLSSVIPYSLELVALRRLNAATFGLLMSLEPALATLAGVLVLGQHMTALLALAVVMVIAASVGTTLTGRNKVPVID